MEQKYFDCTYDLRNSIICKLYDWSYSRLLDNVVVNGKEYKIGDLNDLPSEKVSVRLNFKEGVEPKSLRDFFRSTRLISVNESNIDFSKVRDMSYMFADCRYLSKIDFLKDWDVSGVKKMTGVFMNDCKLSKLDPLENWDMSCVTDASYMFWGCNKLLEVNACKDWNVSHFNDIHGMFGDCMNLKDIEGLRYWNVKNVRVMDHVFIDCISLRTIAPLENWSLKKLESAVDIFSGCHVSWTDSLLKGFSHTSDNLFEHLSNGLRATLVSRYEEIKLKESRREKARLSYERLRTSEQKPNRNLLKQ